MEETSHLEEEHRVLDQNWWTWVEMKGSGDLPFTGAELFLIRTIEDGDHALGLEVFWRRKGTWGGGAFICRSVFCFLKLIHFGGGSYHVGIFALSYPGMVTPSLVVPWLLILQGVSVTRAINSSGRILFCIDEIHSFFNSHLTKGYP